MDFTNHPLQVVEDIRAAVPGRGLRLEFARYTYIENHTGAYPREIFTVPARSVTTAWLSATLRGLAPEQELALQSRVYQGKQTYYLGMIDFDGAPRDPRPILAQVLPADYVERLKLFSSGRSMHGYIPLTMTEDERRQYLGRLLLANFPGQPRVVDSRWVGHRLREGYEALRWSCNTRQYKAYPVRFLP
jgi:hypothetical protein